MVDSQRFFYVGNKSAVDAILFLGIALTWLNLDYFSVLFSMPVKVLKEKDPEVKFGFPKKATKI